MTKLVNYLGLFPAVLISMAVVPAEAQNPGFNFGDLVIGFQTTGTGNASYVLANLGQAGTIRDTNTNTTLVAGGPGAPLNAALTALFGAAWFDRSDVYVGVFTAGSNNEFSGFLVNGDPFNTVYVGLPREQTGPNAFTGGARNTFTPNLTPAQVQDASNGMFNSAFIFENNGTGAVATLSSGLSFTDYNDENSFGAGNLQSNSWQGVFSGGTQQTTFSTGIFGSISGVAAEAAFDLYRVQGVNNTAGQFGFGQPTGVGTYEGTIVLDSTGAVSLIVIPEPASIGLLAMSVGLLGLVRRRRPVAVQ